MSPATPIPSGTLSQNATTPNNLMIGKTVEEFCGKYGSKGDDDNHCAHYVSHVLGLRIPGAALCSNVGDNTWGYENRRNGYCVRVNQIFNSCSNRMFWPEETPTGKCFWVATIPGNILTRDPLTIGTHRRKHIGIYMDGQVYQYSNTIDKVAVKSVAQLQHLYGPKTVMLKCDLP